jgi:hypothetical protein
VKRRSGPFFFFQFKIYFYAIGLFGCGAHGVQLLDNDLGRKGDLWRGRDLWFLTAKLGVIDGTASNCELGIWHGGGLFGRQVGVQIGFV